MNKRNFEDYYLEFNQWRKFSRFILERVSLLRDCWVRGTSTNQLTLIFPAFVKYLVIYCIKCDIYGCVVWYLITTFITTYEYECYLIAPFKATYMGMRNTYKTKDPVFKLYIIFRVSVTGFHILDGHISLYLRNINQVSLNYKLN